MFYNTRIMKKKLFLFAGDACSYWFSFAIMLAIRWGTDLTPGFIIANALPFAALFIAFAVIAYSMQLYQRAVYGSRKYDWLVASIAAFGIFIAVSAGAFYFYGRLPGTAVSPRGSLVLFWLLFGTFFIAWRSIAESILAKRLIERALIIGSAPELAALATFLAQHPEYGFKTFALQEPPPSAEAFSRIVREEGIETIVSTDAFFSRDLYPVLTNLTALNLNFYDPANFYEQKIGKISLESVSAIWILNNVIRRTPPMLNAFRIIGEKFLALLLFAALLPFFALFALVIKLTSFGPALYAQKRVGKHGSLFMLYKFRTMRQNAEPYGPQWALERDPRVTRVGALLRATHLDELPQLINIARGELSFVGPRPERPEFVAELARAIPFYPLRHLVTPGITGWAQINYPYGASTADAKEKLQYDFYYLKHRSFALDISIVLKTIRRFFQNPERARAAA